MDSIKIENKKIGDDNPVYVVAEAGLNHNGDVNLAKQLIEKAAECGADAIKFQTFKTEEFLASNSQYFDNFKNVELSYEEFSELNDFSKNIGISFFSAPFDLQSANFLNTLDIPCFKIASSDLTNFPLIKNIAKFGKPMIISTGMATLAELDETVRTIRESGCEQFVLLQCTSTYPATPGNSNLVTIPHMRELFNCEVGLSDHTMGIGASVAAVAHGATMIEKHFTLNRADGGVDSAFSMEPEEMKQLVIETERAWQSLGKIKYGTTAAEKGSLTFRRSLYIAEDTKKGDVLTDKNLRIVRPGLGLAPKYYDILLGRKVNKDVKKGTAVNWDLIN